MHGCLQRHVCAVLLGLSTCLGHAGTNWFADAVWYQIFPERFRNGDPANDPTSASLEGTWPYVVPKDWRIVPWTADWYALQPWEQSNGRGFYYNTQLRRYGGDLQGIINKLDYLQSLGVNALYLNPIFESPSLHKYGATMYHHVDRHFGPDPKGDLELFAREDAAATTTWQWSAADRLFLKLIAEAHRRNMRVVLDGVFNHVGIRFWALQRAKREGPSSRFAKWFHIRRWDDPATTEDEFDYQGWVGVKDLPEFAKDEHGPCPEVKEHLHAVVRRWMDPNGDGDPTDGIDGWRLDVAAELPLPFWEEFRGWVKTINPQAYITGEIWWDDFNQCTFRNARPWLDWAFDGVMNYRFGDAVYQFFNQPQPIPATQFTNLISAIHSDYGYARCLNLQNLYGSHDTSRLGSAVVNPQCRQDHNASAEHNRDYQVRAPNAAEKQRWRQMVAFQFLMPGAPYIYYGDEAGMWGADDPDCRKPMVWADLNYETERADPFRRPRPANAVSPDRELLKFYRACVKLRHEHAALRRGTFDWIRADDTARVVTFCRSTAAEQIVAAFNVSDSEVKLTAEQLNLRSLTGWRDAVAHKRLAHGGLTIPPRSYRVLERR